MLLEHIIYANISKPTSTAGFNGLSNKLNNALSLPKYQN